MYASEEPSIWSKVAEIGTWTLLFILLVPGTALGFFAENSLPNSPLYPVKRGIEQVVLTLVSFNEGAKSAYELSLANTRFSETKKLLASNTPVTQTELQQFNSVATQLDAAQASINTISDSVQKAQLQTQLKSTVTTYQTQLTQMKQQLQESSTSSPSTQGQTGTQQTNPEQPIPNSTTQSQTNSPQTTTQPAPTSTPQTNTLQGSPLPSTAPVPTINTQNLTDQQKQNLEDQIQQLQDKLQTIQQNYQDTQYPTNGTQDKTQSNDR